jgi:RNA polymerase sigma factor (sigma-70 family)
MGEEELQKVLAGCLKNDRKDQKALYKTFYGFAMGICLRYAVNRYEASEIMNQGFYKAYTKLDLFDHKKPFKAWLGRIMINTAINYYHSNLKMAYTETLDNVDLAGNYDLPDHKLEYDDLLAMIHRLPQAYRTVFNLYAIEGYTHEEIGSMLGISDGTSKSNLFKAREKLKKMVIAAAQLPEASGRDSYYAVGAMDAINFKAI